MADNNVKEAHLQDLYSIRDKLNGLYELAWGMDIPHPTIPEYVELHEKMQKIMQTIYPAIEEYSRKIKELEENIYVK